jgi:hypothetical protein
MMMPSPGVSILSENTLKRWPRPNAAILLSIRRLLDCASALCASRINPNIVGYVGGYYQWDNNWKLTGRFGVQSFGGAQLLNLTPFQPFTQPIVRLDLDRMDDNDNRLFGVTAQIAWVPKPSYQLTFRTPLYAVRN